jgi:L-asparagine transporter-like permease
MGNLRIGNARQTGFVIWLALIPVVLIVLLLLYTWFVLSWSYSEGDRAGYIQKFSKKAGCARHGKGSWRW